MTAGTSPQEHPVVIQVIGEALVDIIHSADGVRSSHAGGSPFNVAIGLGTLGAPTTLVTQIGHDTHGDLIRDHLEQAQVRLTPGSVTSQPTSTAMAYLDESGSASYTFTMTWDPSGISAEHADIVHVGSLATVLAPGADSVERAFGNTPAGTLRSYDPNVRPAAGSPDEIRHAAARFMSLAHLVKLSDDDAQFLYPGLDASEVAREVITLGATLVVITRGAGGCELHAADWSRQVPAQPVTVQDTVGAGDSFMAGFLYEVAQSGVPALLTRRDIDPEFALRCATTAQRSAALTVSHAGARPARPEELNPG